MTPVPPGSIIGIIGGGQLGRMTALAAARLGYKTHSYSPEKDAPASHVSDQVTVAAYDDRKALERFAKSADVVTLEFENIPVATLEAMEHLVPVRPGKHVLHVCQHRIREKDYLRSLSIPTAPFHAIRNTGDISNAWKMVRGKAVLKTAQFGYDGKGQWIVASEAEVGKAWETAGDHESILEGFVPFAKEFSVIIARGLDGAAVVYPIAENLHENGILRRSIVPADIPASSANEAIRIAHKAADAFELVGLLCLEFFLCRDGTVLVNEMAPRPHNSGHWTMDGAVTCQFEQLVRAVCGLPLGPTKCHTPIRMENLLGDEINQWPSIVQDPSAKLHLYGKVAPRPGRKMGHVNYRIGVDRGSKT